MLFDGAIGATAEAIEPDTGNHQGAIPAPVETSAEATPAAEPTATTYVFIDSRIADQAPIVAAAPDNARIVQIDRTESGLTQIQAALAGTHSVDAIHIVSHGQAGRLFIGSSVLTEATITGPYQETLQTIGGHLSDTADLLIYGCNFAEGEDGQAAALALAQATGADVAASDDVTGSEELGGDWILESRTGEVETEAIEAFEFNRVLAPITISVTNTPIVTNPAGTTTQAATVYAGHTGVRVMPGTSNVVGASARWNNAGNLGSQQLDVVATVIEADADDFVQFSSPTNPTATDDDPQLLVGDNSLSGGLANTDTAVKIRWDLFLAGTNTPAAGEFAYLITDVDGTGGNPNTREAVAASVNDPVSYTIRNPSDLVGSIQGDLLRVDGTQNSANSNNSRAWVQFNWVNASSFELTYYLIASNGIAFQAGFSHDGDGDKTFTNSTTASIPKLDLDLSGSGNDYATSFTENGSAVSIADTDIDISNNPGNLEGATITLTNRQVGDLLTTGTLPGGITSTTDTTDPTQIVVTLTGTASPADYQTAIRNITFSNSSEAPDLTDRVINAQVSNSLTAGNNAQTVITINPVNDGPINSLPSSQTVVEDNTLTFSAAGSNPITVSDIDAEGSNLNVTLTVPQGVLALGSTANVTVAGNNSSQIVIVGSQTNINTALDGLSFTPGPNQNGPTTLNIATSDNGNTGAGNVLTAVGSLAISVTAVNDAPVAVNDAESTPEDTAHTFNVRANDSDVDGDAMTVTAINGTAISTGADVVVANGVVNLRPNGSIRFTPNPDFNGTSSFTYTISDGNGASSTASVNMAVTAVNDAPIATNDNQSTAEDTAVSFDATGNDTDVEGDSLAVSHINGSAISIGNPVSVTDGSVALLADGRLTFSPASDFNGSTSFDYTVTDGNGASADASVSVVVTAVNDNPVATDDTASTTEDNAVQFDVRSNDSDLDGDALSVTAINGSAISVGSPVAVTGGSVALLADGRLSFTPDSDVNGSFSFSYTVSDGAGGLASATTTVSVSAQNDAPVAADDTASTTEDNAVLVDLTANDSDVEGDPLTVTAIDGTPISIGLPVTVSNGVVSLQADGRIQFTPDGDFNGNSSFSYTTADGNGGTANANATITVTAVNDVPLASDDAVTATEDTVSIFDPRSNDSDIDGDSLTITEIDGNPITVGSSISVANGSVLLLADGRLQFTPQADFNGNSAFSYQISDGNGGLATANVNLVVNATNDAPVAVNDAATTNEDSAVGIDVRSNDSDIDGDSLTVTQVNGSAITVGSPVAVTNGTVQLMADGSLNFVPAPDFNGTTSFAYTLNDGNGATDTASVAVTVNAVNDAPDPADDTASGTEDLAIDVDVLANDLDIDGDSISVSAVNGSAIATGGSVAVANGSVTLLAHGQLRFNPAADFNGPTSFGYTVTDGNGGTGSAQVDLSIAAVNDAPTGNADAINTNEDTPVNLDVLSNDSDPDGDALGVTAIDGTAISVGTPVSVTGGTVSLLADGRVTFTPNPDFNGPAAFDYTVDDGNGGTATGTVSVTVNPLNDAPVASDDNTTTNEDTPVSIDVVSNDSDVDGDALSVSHINGTAISTGETVAVANGNATLLADGRLSFSPATDFNGTAGFSYTVDDGNSLTDVASVSITVTAVNDSPVASADAFNGTEDTTLTFDPRSNDTDPDGDSLSIVAINGTALATGVPLAIGDGTITRQADGRLVFAPNANFNGLTSFSYTVTDGNGASDSTTATLSLAATNDAPTTVDDAASGNEDTALNLNLLGNDSDLDGDTLAISAIDGTAISTGETVSVANGSVTLLPDGTVTFAPVANFNGSTSFSYTASDGQGGQSSATATVVLGAINDAPSASDDTLSVSEDSAGNLNVLTNDNDIDGDALAVIAIDGSPVLSGDSVAVSNGTVTLESDGTLTFAPATNFNGSSAFSYTIEDSNGASATANVAVAVAPANDDPVTTDDTVSTVEDTPVNFDPTVNDSDIDGDSLSVSEINGVAPTVGVPVIVTGGTVTLEADGSLTFTPATNVNGAVSFTYTVTDGNGGQAAGTINLGITPQNDAPVPTPDSAVTPEDTAVIVDVRSNDSDPEGDSLSVTAINGTSIATGVPIAVVNGTVTLESDGRLLVQPDPDFVGVISFDSTISDGNGASASATADITVTAVNDAPAAIADSFSGTEDTALNFDVRTNDTDTEGDPLSVVQINGSALAIGTPVAITGGSISLEPDGTLSFSPTPNFNGSPSFSYSVSDGNGATGAAAVTLTIAAVNDAPAASNDSASTAEEAPVAIDVRGNDTDIDGDSVTVTRVNSTPIASGETVAVANGTVTLQANGELLFSPAADFAGTSSFDYQISDPSGLTATATVSVNVSNTNDNPVAIDDSITTNEDQTVILNLLGNDTDVDGDTLTVGSIDGTAISIGATVAVSNGQVTLRPDGQISFAPASNFNGLTTFSYGISDGNGGTTTAIASVTVNPVNDAPLAIDDSASLNEDTSLTITPLANDSDPESDPLTIAAIDGQAVLPGDSINVTGGSVTLQADGSLIFTPSPDYNGSPDFGYTVSDGNGGTATATINLTVTAVNDAPVASPDSATTVEETPVTIDLRGNDSDVDADPLSVVQIDGTAVSIGSPVNVAQGVVALQADGTVIFTPTSNFTGIASFDYQVSDGAGGVATATATVTVTPVNDSPLAVDDSASTNEDNSVIIDAPANDSDPDGDTVLISEIAGTAVVAGDTVAVSNGTATLLADGTVRFTPSADFAGSTSFLYTISDGNNASDSGSINVTVNPVNDAPVAVDDAFNVTEDTPLTIDLRLNDGDVDGDPVSVTAIDGSPLTVGNPVSVTGGSVTLQAGGSLLFSPASNFNGPASFTYELSDGNGGSSTAQVNLLVAAQNDAPQANPESASTNEDTTVVLDLTANDTDLDGDTLSVTQINGSPASVGVGIAVANGTATLLADGSVSFAPAADFFGTTSFAYQIGDGNGGVDTATATITVAPVNDAPIATADSASTTEEQAVTINVVLNDSDPESDPLLVSEINGTAVSVGAPVNISNGQVTLLADGNLSFTPAPDFNGSASFTYTVSDGNGGIANAPVTVLVSPVNDAPVATADSATTAEEIDVVVDALNNDSDIDGDSISVSAIDGTPISVGNPVAVADGSVHLQADGRLLFSPATDFAGVTTFAYQVEDPSGETATATITITVTNVNDNPVAIDDSVATDEDQSVLIDVTGNDTDSDADSLSVSAIDGTPISVGASLPVSNGQVSLLADGRLSFTPTGNFTGLTTFTYSVTDGNGGAASAIATVTVNPVNDAPVALDDAANTAEDTPLDIDALGNDSDLDGDFLSISQIQGTPIVVGDTVSIAGGSVQLLANGSLRFTPATNFNGATSFDYTISDGNGASDTGQINLSVSAQNDNPGALPDNLSTAEDTPVSIDLLANDNDVDGDSLIVSQIDGNPAVIGSPVTVTQGTATLQANGQVLFTPAANFNGTTSFSYQVSDGAGGFATETATITVVPVNDIPVAINDSATTNEDQSITFDVRANDSDPDGEPLTVTAVNGTPITVNNPIAVNNGQVTLLADGRLDFTPGGDVNGSTSFDYTVSDASGATASATASININPQNDAPVALDNTASTGEDLPVNLNPLDNDSDIDGDSLSITAINGAGITAGSTVSVTNGSVTLEPDGTLTFNPQNNFNGTASFDYTIGDGNLGQATATVSVQVAASNDGPVAIDDVASGTEDQPLVFDVRSNDTDVENDSLQVTQINGTPIDTLNPVAVPGGVISLQTDGQLNFTPDAHFNGSSSFSYTIVDSGGLPATATATLSFAPVNDTPSAIADAVATAEDTPVDIDVLINDNDVDGDSLAVVAVDGSPIITNQTISVADGQVTLLPSGQLRFTPAANYNGSTGFSYTVDDGSGGQASTTVSVNVSALNDAPTAVDDSLNAVEDTPLTFDVTGNDNDPDGDGLSVTHINGAVLSVGSPVATTHGVVALQADGRLTFSPAGDYSGAETFTYTISDGAGGSANALVTLNISPVNDAPVGTDDTATTAEDTAITLDLTANDLDVDADPLTVSQINGAAITPGNAIAVTNGTVQMLLDGSLVFTPASNYVGPVSFSYTASDGNGGVTSANVTINVGGTNDAPTAADDSASTSEDTPVGFDVRNNDSDIDGDPLTISAIDGVPVSTGSVVSVAGGEVTLLADGRLLFAPATNTNGASSFTYTISDGNGGLATATATVNVTPVNDAPVATNDTLSATEDTALSFDPRNNDTDPEADPLSVSQINSSNLSVGVAVPVANGSVTLQADGSLSFQPAPDFNGQTSFSYTVIDNNGGSDIASVTMNVTAVNDAPSAAPDAVSTPEDTPVTLDVAQNDSDPDGDTLSVSAIDGTPVVAGDTVSVSNGVVTRLPDGRLTFSPAANYNGTTSFAYTVTDGLGGTSDTSVSITVIAVNDAPIALDDTASVAEDNAVNLSVLSNDSDVDADPLTISQIDGNPVAAGVSTPVANGVVLVNADGSLSFTPDPDYTGVSSFDYTVTDSSGATAVATATITVSPVNDAPVAVPESISTNEDTPIDIDVRANDSDPDSDPITVTRIDGVSVTAGTSVPVSNGVVTLLPSGQLGFVPAANFNGATTFNYTISDPSGDTSTATVSVTVAASNDAPAATDDTAVTNEDTAITLDLTANDTDPEGDPVSIDQVNGTPISIGVPLTVANGQVSLQADGRLTFTPSADQNGLSSFTYRVTDSQGGFASASATITINAINDAPTAVNDSFLTNEDTGLNLELRANDTDLEGDSLTVNQIDGVAITTGASLPVSNGTVTLLPDGTLNYQPTPDFSGSSTFAYSVSDGNGGLSVANVTIVVASANDAPVAANDSATTLEDTAVTLDVVANDTDVDGDSLAVDQIDSVAILSGQTVTVANGQVTLLPDGRLSFQPDADFNGLTTFAVSVNDGNGGAASSVASVTVQPVADPPVAADDTVAGVEDQVLTLDPRLNDTDPDADALSINQINGAPISVGSSVNVADGTVDLLGDGTLAFTPDQDFNGSTSFTYSVNDGTLDSNTATISLAIAASNDAPVALDDTGTTTEDTAVTLAVTGNDTDIDGDNLAVITVDGNAISPGSPVTVANGIVELTATGDLSFQPSTDFSGVTTFVYGISDGNSGADTATVTMTVTPVNDAPLASNDSANGTEDQPLTIDVRVNDVDPDGDQLRVAAINGVALTSGSPVTVSNGTVDLAGDGSLVFTPNADFNGPTSFSYTVVDDNGGSTGATVNLVIDNSNDAPLATNDLASTNEDTAVQIDVVANDSDIDGDPLGIIEIDGSPVAIGTPVAVTNGMVTLLPNGRLSFSPTANFNGTSSFAYTVSDGNGGTAQATTSITINPANDAPLAADDSFSVAEDNALLIDSRGNDIDPEGDPLTVLQIDGTAISIGQTVAVANGSVTLQADGRLQFTADTDFTGIVSFGYLVGDGNGASATATVTITVTPVNDNPVASNDSASGQEDTILDLPVLANDTDIDGDALQVTAVNGQSIAVGSPVTVANGQVSLLANGSLRFTPALNFNGATSFDYTIDDSNGASDSATASLSISSVNDSPVGVGDSLVTAQDTPYLIDVRTNDSDADGDALTVTSIDGSPVIIGSTTGISNGTITVEADGRLRFDPTPGFQGTSSFNYVVSDGSASSTATNVAITVTPPNNAPIATDDAIAATEEISVNFDPRTNDSDPDGNPISIRSVDGDLVTTGVAQAVANGTVTLLADGSLTFSPATDFFGVTSFDYELADSFGATDTATITLTVANVDDGITAVNDSFAVQEDTPLVLEARGNDIDVDNDTLTVAQINGVAISTGSSVAVADGTVTLQADGRLLFAPAPDFNGTTSFTYTLNDGNGNLSSAQIDLTVAAVNDAPNAQNDAVTTTEDNTLVFEVRGNDIDPEGDLLNVVQIDGVAISTGSPVPVSNGVITLLADGRLSFAPNADFNGTSTFSYQVSDASGATSTASVDINVTPVNDGPAAFNDSFTTAEDTPVNIDIRSNDTDPDADPLGLTSINGQPVSIGVPVGITGGQITLLADGSQTFDPAPNFTGTASFAYEVLDSGGVTAGATASILVTAVNDAPIANPDSSGTAEDVSVTLDLRANDTDPDGDSLTVIAINGIPLSTGTPVIVTNGSITRLNDGTVTFAPDANFNGTTSFVYTAADASGASASSTATIIVSPANDAPTANPDTFTTNEEAAVLIDPRVNDLDVDADPLQLVSINGISITVNVPQSVSNGSVELLADGRLRFVPDSNFSGTSSFTYTIGDGSGQTATAVVNMVVNPLNDAPLAADDLAQTAEDTAIQIDVLSNDIDPDGDGLQVVQVDGSPLGLNSPVTVADGTVSLTADNRVLFSPAPNFNGPTSFSYRVEDPLGLSSTATVNLVVSAVNDAPFAVDDSISTPEDTSVEFPVMGNDADPEGQAISVRALNGQAVIVGQTVTLPHGTAVLLANGNIRFTPASNFNGQTSFSYSVSDSAGASADARININILPLNDIPEAFDDVYAGATGGVLIIDPRENDVDADHPGASEQLRLVAIDGQALNTGDSITLDGGTITLLENGRLQFRSTGQSDGTVRFNYQIQDEQAALASAQVTINLRTFAPPEMSSESDLEIISPIESTPTKIDPARSAEAANEGPLYIGRAVRDSQAQTDHSIDHGRDNIATGDASRFAWDSTLAGISASFDSTSSVRFAHIRADRVFGPPGDNPMARFERGNHNLACWADDTPQSVLALNQLLGEEDDSQLAREGEPAQEQNPALCLPGDQEQHANQELPCDPVSSLLPSGVFSRFTEQLARARTR